MQLTAEGCIYAFPLSYFTVTTDAFTVYTSTKRIYFIATCSWEHLAKSLQVVSAISVPRINTIYSVGSKECRKQMRPHVTRIHLLDKYAAIRYFSAASPAGMKHLKLNTKGLVQVKSPRITRQCVWQPRFL